MLYYIMKKDDQIIGFKSSRTPLLNPSYIEVSKEEFIKFTGGFESNPPTGTEAELENLKNENILLKAQIKAQSDAHDFLEDCITEMAQIVYA